MASNKPHLLVFMPLCSPYQNGLIVTDKVWWKTRYVTANTSSEKTLASALLSPGSLTQRKTSTVLWGHSSSPGEACLAGNWALPPTAGTTLSDTWASHFASRSSSPNSAFRWLHQFSSVQSLSHVQLFPTPRTAAHQAFLSVTNPRRLLKLKSIKSVMPSSHLIICRPLLLLPSIFPSIREFSNESTFHIRWPKYRSCSFSISPSN